MAKVRMQFKPPTTTNKADVEAGDGEFDRNDGAVQILRKTYTKSGFIGWYQVTFLKVSSSLSCRASALKSRKLF